MAKNQDLLDFFKPRVREILMNRSSRAFKKVSNLFNKHPLAYHHLFLEERIFRDLAAIRKIIISVNPDPILYYFGIGNVEKYDIDIITPLITTDFKRMLATDRVSTSFEMFKEIVLLELGLLKGIDTRKIVFKKITPAQFKARFFYGKWREIIFFCGFDATLDFPQELKQGYHILFTRRTGVLFFQIKAETKESLLKHLISDKSFVIFQEIMHSKKEGQNWENKVGTSLGEEFLKVDLETDRADLDSSKRFDKVICFKKKGGCIL